MGELREATLQYINCADPTESVARKHRVQQSDEHGLMEETARNIVEGAAHSQAVKKTEPCKIRS